jgi:nucleoside-diphosphate-sugar epimerase
MTTDTRILSSAVLVTGANGLIGEQVAAGIRGFKPAEPGLEVIGLDLEPPQQPVSQQNPGALTEFFQGDVTDEDSLRQALLEIRERTGGHLTSVIHLAAYYDFSGEPSPLYNTVTVEGTRRLLTLLRELRFDVEQFVFSSSLLVMQPEEHGHSMSEYSPTEAEWAYPQSKLDAEQVIQETHGDIPVVILRIAGVYDEQCHSLPISQQISRIHEKQLQSHLYPGDPSHGQAFVHVKDLVSCICQVITSRKSLSSEELFLIAEPDVMSYGELQNAIGEELFGQEWTTLRIPKAVAKAGAWVIDRMSTGDDKPFIKPFMIDLADDHYQPNISHARSRLNWEPRERLRDTLPEMLRFLQENPQEFYAVNKLGEPAGTR